MWDTSHLFLSTLCVLRVNLRSLVLVASIFFPESSHWPCATFSNLTKKFNIKQENRKQPLTTGKLQPNSFKYFGFCSHFSKSKLALSLEFSHVVLLRPTFLSSSLSILFTNLKVPYS